MRLHLPPYSGAADVKVQLFTTAFRKVSDTTYSQVNAGTDISFKPVDSQGNALANGVYYVAVNYWEGPPGSGATYVHAVSKLLVAR